MTYMGQSIEDCLPLPPKQEFDEFGGTIPLPPVSADLDSSGNALPPWRCIAYGTLARTQVCILLLIGHSCILLLI